MDARERRPILLVRTAVSPLATQNFNVDELLSTFHLNSLATRRDHEIFGSFPRASIGDVGLTVSIPTAHYMLALKLKAMRVNDPAKGATEIKDIRALLQVTGISTVDSATHCLAKFFPKSAAASRKQRFLLRDLFPELAGGTKSQKSNRNAPRYPLRSGSPRDPGRDYFGR
ncbi:hypothetical protein [Bosea massiliensis]|uniref:Uncharacterized protein n=1 Tax=Bosea massiliensis TaxID=151419 RepID=A0ABW0P5L5_9HYPH